MNLRPYRRWRPQRDDQGQGKEHQRQDRVESGEDGNVCTDGRKDFCLDEIDAEQEPDEKLL